MPKKHSTYIDQSEAERQRVGATLRAIRESRGEKLGEFAAKVPMASSTLSNIEAGRRPLTNERLARIAFLLGVSQLAIKRPDAAPTPEPAEDVPA